MKRITEYKQEVLLIAILLLSILPFLILNYFNQPTSEDFFYGEETARIGFLDSYRVLFKYYGGRYFGYLLMMINPLYLKSIAGYKALTFLLMILYFYILYLFVSEFTKKSLSFRYRIIISLSIFFLYLYSMPSVSQGFYWYFSAIFYHIGLSLILLFSIFYNRQSEKTQPGLKTLYVFLCGITIAAIAGSSELTAATIFLLIIILFLKSIFIDNKFNWVVLFLLIVTFVSVYIAYTAPGNTQRANQYTTNHNLIYSIESAITYAASEIISWIFLSPLLILTFILIPVLSNLVNHQEKQNIFAISPIYSLASLLLIIFVNTFLPFWSAGISPYGRIVNVIYFIFLIGWFYNVVVLISYFKKRFNFNLSRLPKYSYSIALVLIIVFMLKDNNIKTAYTELLGGDAYNYDKELNDRYNFILESKSDTVVVDSIKNVPKSFFLFDIFPDPDVFYNKGYAMYFNKKAIYIK